jgi:hypothetical protein
LLHVGELLESHVFDNGRQLQGKEFRIEFPSVHFLDGKNLFLIIQYLMMITNQSNSLQSIEAIFRRLNTTEKV